jgi:hypothetical protein
LRALKKFDEAVEAAESAARLDPDAIGPRVKMLLAAIAEDRKATP